MTASTTGLRRLCTAAVATFGVATLTLAGSAVAADRPAAWNGTWSTAVTGAATPPQPATFFADQTLRQIVHTSIAGRSLRVRLSNEYGTEPLVIGEARIARGAGGARIVAGTDRRLTFGGRSAFSIPPGAPALSDPVALPVPALSDLVVSIHLPERTAAATVHGSAFQTNYVAAGNVTRSATLTGATTTTSWHFLSGVSVAAPRAASVVAFGDSITDGAITTVDANHRWPDFLARRLRGQASLRDLGVLNKGIGGNRLLHDGNTLPGSPFSGIGPLFGDSALNRFDRDVLAQPGARCVIVLLGINDIGQPSSIAPPSEAVTAEEMIFGYRQLIARAHERGLRILGATMTPFQDTAIPGYYSEANEAKRVAVNRWIRASGEYDGVIDFDRAVRDPAQPSRILPRYDSGDHLHPNDDGMRAMADAIPLRLLQTAGDRVTAP
ncbi:GDSL family lipase [Actinoplanes sp. ATCC 53533]|uniref:SGNH/GDSL hydrolase family protein n=1 Tax=Actinoplanes sp. ATCC 53533 TaxID=1288362 RepID=UPI000F768B16|nr:SGNH/GDSL hydrolase family protein [Actinoplanes sp. ATCC 53533]RSM58339.1 GDSL family lipase [Actinoplanes sp. ATCC 53533]